MASTKVYDNLIFEDYAIPILLCKELRNSVRFSVTKKGVVIRCPYLTSSKNITSQAKTWCKTMLDRKPAAFTEFRWKDYRSDKHFSIYGDKYNLEIKSINTIKDRVSWNVDTILLEIHDQYNPIQESKVIKSLLAKFVAKKYQFIIANRVRSINEKYFNVPIGRISLKNNRSNWGSCSSKGNINLSIKLLKAPKDVIDYVIIHELAHRIELNHSPRFWKIVKEICPGYKEKEKWLNQNSHLCII